MASEFNFEAGPTVNSVAEELVTRLGSVGESAGELMHRDVKGFVDGAQSVAEMAVQTDTMSAFRVDDGAAGRANHDNGRLQGTGPDYLASDSITVEQGLGTVEKDPAVIDLATAAPVVTDGQQLTPVPADSATPPGDLSGSAPTDEPIAPELQPASPAQPVPASPLEAGSAAESMAGAGHTPWTVDSAGNSSTTGHLGNTDAPASTPWHDGTSTTPTTLGMPGMPGRLMDAFSPEQRPPRRSSTHPWSRGRTKQDETVFPRERP